MPSGSLRRALERGDSIIAPGAWDAITARLFRFMGFDALYVPGRQTALVLGTHELLTLTELAMVAERVSEGVQDEQPVIVDAGAGFGEGAYLRRTVEVLEVGVDVLFPIALRSREDYELLRREIPDVPMMALMFGPQSSPFGVPDFESMGYQLIHTPLTSVAASIAAIHETYRNVLDTGHPLTVDAEKAGEVERISTALAGLEGARQS